MANKIQSGGITVELESPDDALLVEAYGDGGFRLIEKRVEGSIFVNGEGFFPIAAQSFDALTTDEIDAAIATLNEPEILLIGTGETMQLLPKRLRMHLEAKNIGFDVMSTGAAARTYNVLKIENRRVLAILIQVS
ncbi:Mth938-like domain-containing protein [Kordiimonas aquimaris]|uniref:Mth938-like domain-containing protein n=1 Tax=Kordiimonas aquimaris TaxID=707591 RepID=UPI0021D2E327|nr:Mth938-like domain-containing protein [Kordiimonas aquimaris]